MLLGNGSRLFCFIFLALMLFSQGAYALTLTPEVSAGLKYSNNPLLRESNVDGSWIFSTFAAAAIEEHSKLLSLAANTSIRSESYANGDINIDDSSAGARGVENMAKDEQVCGCMGVTKGDIVNAVADGCDTFEA